ncbi:hypothetical protein AB0A95_16860 [Micromonospora sp. NPDC049230]|uniref:hypothetical protein n=1 Tax=Micromonospora sp. NPDC049230 TaxID=3155502 RepID=UPI0034067B7D
MQEQPPSESTRREPAERARRRSPRPTFTPPTAAEQPEKAAAPPAPAPASPRPRRAKSAPAVLFQPPEPDRPLPRQPDRLSPSPSAPPTTDQAGPPDQAPPATDQAGPTGQAPPATDQAGTPETTPAAEQASPPAGGRQPSTAPPARTPTARATPRKASARKTATSTATAPAGPAVAGTTDGPTGQAPTPTEQPTTPSSATTAPTRRAAPPKTAAPTKSATPTKSAAKKAAPTKSAAPAKKATPTKRAAPTKTAAPTEEATNPATQAATPASHTASTARRAATPPRSAPASETTSTPQTTATPPQSAPPTETTPATPTAAIPALVGDPVPGRTPESELRAVAARVLDHPGFAPELLALAAVRSLGPGAADWAARVRDRYPDAPADGLARLVTRRYVRAAGAGGATAALAGFFAPLAELASVSWTQANLVLHLAAVYGKDPAHPDRAVELLVLTQVHPDAGSAREALAAAQTAGDPVEGAWPRAAEAAWRLAAPLTAQAGGWVALRLVARLLPGAAVLAAALGDAAAADRLAARTVAVYRPR